MPSIVRIAKTCHEVNRAYCKIIGDNSQPSWNDAPDWQKQSAINGVKFHLSNPNSKPSDSHKNWLNEKRKDGWKYGKKKDTIKKLHPCMVPYSKLPKKQQAKDALFISVIKSFIN
ncbi:RyR domain-containing protein [Lishizhenia sp.]|uniref:RyR domain-containing protein n=1 Tax=Lishizhenia sp. TaxID=2497594 RepID=UPI00299D84C2|nr:RyR domain-containing protein [Lishizhenia sp.]MDX1446616.1 RyR domain-containing protein [Lishizhenia sp.]